MLEQESTKPILEVIGDSLLVCNQSRDWIWSGF